ncbi:protein-tyrosine-phosphatase PTP1-like isoform X2 [Primulina tabacum]|uniref:protein-tyrosine-phosphatase PTP1-like isoform X2 n=1 Tax=Primulina tabacum TaxID=48773 RepID=UPI003F5A3BE6
MTTAGKDLSSKTTVSGTATLPSAAAKSFDFSPDLTMPGPRLTSDQIRYCSEALQCFSAKKFNSPQSIRQEFQILQANRMRALDMRNRCTVALDGTNHSKNRYTDVLPFDDNRVILKQSKHYRPSARGYINASFVRTSESVSGFIATQGPLPHTYEDFWEMIIQYRCPVIIMLTRLVDNYQSEEPPLSVLHIQYPEWPDHGVPKDTFAVREIFNKIYTVPPDLGPIVVHCSAGIGRTGTYCAIHNTIQRVLAGDMTALDLVNTITTFRSQRIGMVQTLEQYLFCYDVIVDELEKMLSDNNSQSRA